MDIIKTPLILLASLLLIACGSDSNNPSPAEIIFPEHLPKVNPSLNQDSRIGIWMVYQETDIVSEDVVDGFKEKSVTKFTSNELSIIDNNKDDIAILAMCNFYDLHQHFGLNPSLTDKGYQYTYSGSLNHVDDISTGHLEISYSHSNQQLYGKGSRRYQYKNKDNFYRDEITTLYAIKVSDTANFNFSNEVQYSSSIETEHHTEIEFSPLCIGLSDRATTVYKNSVNPEYYHTKMVQQFSLGQESLTGIEIFNATGPVDNESAQRVGGSYTNEENYTLPWQRNTQCTLNDSDCLDKETLNIKIEENNSSGLAFSARLDSDDGGFLDVQVSAIINPFEVAPETQE